MPRGPRLDTPGTLHHVMMRGIEKGLIFHDDQDRRVMLTKIGALVEDTGTSIYSFALMPNHVHLLLKSGESGLPAFMRRLLSSYAVYFNKRHERIGHVFQNRYKSIICEEELYFRKLVAYINLNPLRGGLADSFDRLVYYPWCSHGRIAFGTNGDWLDRHYVLRNFGETNQEARQVYLEFIAAELPHDRTKELNGGGLVRSKGGWSEVKSMRRQGKQAEADDRILGSDAFVRQVIRQAEQRVSSQLSADERAECAQKEIKKCCQQHNITVAHLRSGSRNAGLPLIRKQIACKLVNELGITLAETARLLGVTTSAVNKMLRKQGTKKGTFFPK
ncbi:transposase [Prosthecochloris sp. HL-130-GSB]|uniref:transposase n=1 Tax=Prosthecochloris sp. HL-130-GSB TaxID=1974213 RepID=UPI000A1C0F98|nr:transposase [Prosthecochloris sp. HL-130-GSB]ARM31399.1 hypothetical protein B9H02_08955 [Prosthecochloris sp. HL-130-GSB]